MVFGLGDKLIFYLIIFYGYGDYYGGFGLIKLVYSLCIVMSEIEWYVLENDVFVSYCWGVKFEKDLLIEDGDVFNVNGIELVFYVMLGYILGMFIIVFFVIDGDEWYCVVLWGGIGFNYGLDVVRIKFYINLVNIMKVLVKE